MSNFNYVISVANNTTVQWNSETRLASTLSVFEFHKTARFEPYEAASTYAQQVIDELKNNPAVTPQELKYVTSRPWSIIEYTRNLCVNCKQTRVHGDMNRCLRCSYM